ncbi:MAG TPA: hypothetical protein V6C97_19610 [Oculatellaceae cyanobacterium]
MLSPKLLPKCLVATIAISALVFSNANAAEETGKTDAAAAPTAGSESPEHKKAMELNEKGQDAMKSKDYNEAVKNFRTALDLSVHFDEAKKKSDCRL